MKDDKKTFNDMPKWKDVLTNLGAEYRKQRQDKQKKEVILKERLKLPWSLRESVFWVSFRGMKLYDEIKKVYFKKYSNEKARELLNELDCAIDEWDSFITKVKGSFESSKKFKIWEEYLLNRDCYRCKECDSTEDLKVHNIISLSEQLANYVKNNSYSINNIDISTEASFYKKDNGIILCFKCYDHNDHCGDIQADIHRMRITDTCIETKNRQKEWFKLGDIHTEVRNKLEDAAFNSKEWFSEKLSEVRKLQDKIAYSTHEPPGGNRLLEANILFRIGKYDLAKRLAMRQEGFWRRELDERRARNSKKNKNSFAERNWQIITSRTIDQIVERYKKSDYSIQYTWIYASYGAEKYRELFRAAENEIRNEMGVPLIGEGWIAETEVFYLVKDVLSEYEVIHHARPKWLDGQEFDIYIPQLKLAIEYMGEQHYRPVDFFGGEKGFEKSKRMDEKKQKKTEQHGKKILYIRYDDKIDRETLRKKIECLIQKDN